MGSLEGIECERHVMATFNCEGGTAGRRDGRLEKGGIRVKLPESG